MTEMRDLVDNYFKWLKDKTVLSEVKDWTSISVPFLDIHNDYLQIYAKKEGNKIIMTDDSYILSDLETSGCAIDSKKRKELLNIALNSFGIKKDENDALIVEATESDFSFKKHCLIQGMMSIHDMFYTSSPYVASIFLEEVSSWLTKNDIKNVASAQFRGKSGYSHTFEFVIPGIKNNPERFIKTATTLTKEKAQAMVFSWLDTKEARIKPSKAYAMINDKETEVPEDAIDALTNYDIIPIRWSQRRSMLSELAA